MKAKPPAKPTKKPGRPRMGPPREGEDPGEVASREALAKLTVRQRKLVEYYVTTGKMRESARQAGYGGNDHTLAQIASYTLRLPYVAAVLEAMIDSDPAVLGRSERLRMRSDIASDPSQPVFARLAALDALDKIQGKLIDRLEVSGPGGGAIRMELEHLSTAELRKIAEEPDVEP